MKFCAGRQHRAAIFRDTGQYAAPPHRTAACHPAYRGGAEVPGVLRENPNEAALLFKELLIGVTGFFATCGLDALEREVLPALLRTSRTATRCASGFRLLDGGKSLFRRHPAPGIHGSEKKKFAIQIYATDIDPSRSGTRAAASFRKASRWKSRPPPAALVSPRRRAFPRGEGHPRNGDLCRANVIQTRRSRGSTWSRAAIS